MIDPLVLQVLLWLLLLLALAVLVVYLVIRGVTAVAHKESRRQRERHPPRNRPYNVKDYGAVGDGVTDDTAAIQAAIDAATSTSDDPPHP